MSDHIEEEKHASAYPQSVVELAQNPPYYSRMYGFTNSACIKGPCGDSMEFYLKIKDDMIEEVSFYTKGCVSTRACGAVAARFVAGKNVSEALGLSPKFILDELNGLPGHFSHCAILSVSTFLKAIADHLLQQGR